MTIPHEKWAQYYDHTYELTFGNAYQTLTSASLQNIRLNVTPPAKIIDFGAGTGRLTIPLAQQGYHVTAVEPCREMLNILVEKSSDLPINSYHGKIEDYHTQEQFDMALSVFTVISYILDEESLNKSFHAISNSLIKGGYLLIDIPSANLFQSYSVATTLIKRNVVITSEKNDLFTYTENTTIFNNNGNTSFNDTFTIRYWNKQYILKLLSDNFIIKEKVSGILNNSGTDYYLLVKN